MWSSVCHPGQGESNCGKIRAAVKSYRRESSPWQHFGSEGAPQVGEGLARVLNCTRSQLLLSEMHVERFSPAAPAQPLQNTEQHRCVRLAETCVRLK